MKQEQRSLRRKALLTALLIVSSSALLLSPGARPRTGERPPSEDRDRKETPARPKPLPHPAPEKLFLRSSSALLIDQSTGDIVYSKNPDVVTPIASVTKLMTAMVLLDAKLPMDEPIKVTDDDIDTIKESNSRLPVGWVLSRHDLLHLALMSSENRAASAVARTYPGGLSSFVIAMNQKAHQLGMNHSRFADSSGLNCENVSTAEDLAKMVQAAYHYDTIREMTTCQQHEVHCLTTGRVKIFGNSNLLVWDKNWEIGLSKTGFIAEAGHCLVMQTTIQHRPLVMILLNSEGKYSRIGDARRMRLWLDSCGPAPPSQPRRVKTLKRHHRR